MFKTVKFKRCDAGDFLGRHIASHNTTGAIKVWSTWLDIDGSNLCTVGGIIIFGLYEYSVQNKMHIL